jgi:hypothetical protein
MAGLVKLAGPGACCESGGLVCSPSASAAPLAALVAGRGPPGRTPAPWGEVDDVGEVGRGRDDDGSARPGTRLPGCWARPAQARGPQQIVPDGARMRATWHRRSLPPARPQAREPGLATAPTEPGSAPAVPTGPSVPVLAGRSTQPRVYPRRYGRRRRHSDTNRSGCDGPNPGSHPSSRRHRRAGPAGTPTAGRPARGGSPAAPDSVVAGFPTAAGGHGGGDDRHRPHLRQPHRVHGL